MPTRLYDIVDAASSVWTSQAHEVEGTHPGTGHAGPFQYNMDVLMGCQSVMSRSQHVLHCSHLDSILLLTTGVRTLMIFYYW